MRIPAQVVAVIVLILNASSGVAQQKKPNIIVIAADDHAYQAISAYGSDLIRTPNIDQIANEGAVMDRAYVTNSICSASRAVILTGKYSHQNGLKDNGTYFNGAQQTFPKILQQNGYKTAVIGKWHLWSAPTGFDYWNILPAQGHYYNPGFIKMGRDTVYQGYVTDVISDISIDWLNKNKNSPFCLLLFHKAPHRNWMPPVKYLGAFSQTKFRTPHNFNDDYKGRLALLRQQISVAKDLDIRYDSKIPCDSCPVTKINDWAPMEYQRETERLNADERKAWDSHYLREFAQFRLLKSHGETAKFQFQRYMEDYLACVKALDDNVGRVLAYLKEQNLDRNTIIIYMSDQGFYLGEHGLYDKRFMYEESFRTPMLIKYPALISEPKRNNSFVLNLDIAPTLLDLAGIQPPADMQGASMRTLLEKGKDRNWRKEIYYHYYEKSFGLTPHYGIRTNRHKLIHFYELMDSWELYDLKKDPNEVRNIYADEQYKRTVKKLKKRLQKLMVFYKDTGFHANAGR
ncbi:MAG: sulfatase [Candidatus Nephrothrix sp. EaCA]|nr:MAG: sulfatase [Candidatus Nephrothrix sp. EaCA]